MAPSAISAAGKKHMPKSKKSITEKTKKSDKPAKETKAVAKKKPAEKVEKPEKAAVKPAAVKAKKTVVSETVISLDDISMRAYYIAERREAMGWPGDSTSDWVEAERQLKSEAKKAKR